MIVRAKVWMVIVPTFALSFATMCFAWASNQSSEISPQNLADEKHRTFIAGIYYDTVAIGTKRVVADKQQPHLYAALFGTDGQASWLRSFGPLVPGRATSFVSDKSTMMVAGIVDANADIAIDRFHVNRVRLGSGPDLKQALFLVSFDRDGRATQARVVAEASEFSGPRLRHKGALLELSVAFKPPLALSGENQVRQAGGELRLQIGAHGDVRRSTVLDTVSKSSKTGARTNVIGSESPRSEGTWALASMMQQTPCDYCDAEIIFNPAPSCLTCRERVCRSDSWCCYEEWDIQCMRDANVRCGDVGICNCSHSTGTTGVAMQPFCTSAVPNRAACVRTVVGRLPNCSTADDWYNGWAQSCVNEANFFCGSPPP
jgi:hypothetical protein